MLFNYLYSLFSSRTSFTRLTLGVENDKEGDWNESSQQDGEVRGERDLKRERQGGAERLFKIKIQINLCVRVVDNN